MERELWLIASNFYRIIMSTFGIKIINFPLILKLKYRAKIHNFTYKVNSLDYVFEPIENSCKAYMTGYSKGVRECDRIILKDGLDNYIYQVERIDYCSNPSDMWIALLKLAMD